MKYCRESPRLARTAVQKIQEKLYGPPPRDEISLMAKKIVKETGLKGTSVERYWELFIICALLDGEPFVRYWKKKKESKQEWRTRMRARAKALMVAAKRKYGNTNGEH